MQFVLRYIFPFKIPRFIAETTAELYFWCRKKRRGSVAAEPRLAGLSSPWGRGVCAKHTKKGTQNPIYHWEQVRCGEYAHALVHNDIKGKKSHHSPSYGHNSRIDVRLEDTWQNMKTTTEQGR